jgi:putative membrane protein
MGLLWLKGVLMGAADVVPGVSGGTMALITGIYDRLIGAIASISPKNAQLLFQGQLAEFWRRIDGAFLLSLLAGIATAFVFLAGLIRWLLQHQPLVTWSFFFGLILASAVLIVQRAKITSPAALLWIIPGLVLGWWISGLTQVQIAPSLLMVFFSGMLAITAMILPGISGSFILLLLGMYSVLLAAVDERQWTVLAVFVAGAVGGLLGFSHFLKWLLARYHRQTLLFLCGLMLGSLRKIWPWKTIAATEATAGQKIAPWQLPLADLLLSLLAVGLAMAIVFLAHYWGEQWARRRAAHNLSPVPSDQPPRDFS